MKDVDILKRALEWLDQKKSCALATVIWKQGSALRGVGARMGISSEMEIAGSISGGCVEGAVVQEALKVSRSGEISIMDFGISDETAWSVGLACGGSIKVLIQPIKESGNGMDRGLIKKILHLIETRQLFLLATVLSGKHQGDTVIVTANSQIIPDRTLNWWTNERDKELLNLHVPEFSEVKKIKSKEIFLSRFSPEPRLVIIGAGHLTQCLVDIAKPCSFYIIVIDPRKIFTEAERLPGADELLKEWPQEALKQIQLVPNDFLLLLSHDDKLDLPALSIALDNLVRYIGMLSSQRTRKKRLETMAAEGYSPQQLRSVRAPVGLDIGAQSPQEIAVSILAELISVRSGKSG